AKPASTGPSIEALVREGFVELCMPASVAVNENLDVLLFHGEVDSFVRFPQGRPSQNLSKMIVEDFRIDLRALVHRARESGNLAMGARRPLRTRDGDCMARLAVRPLKVGPTREFLYLVSCERVDSQTGDATAEIAVSSTNEARVIELEQELVATREHLQTVVEELETSNEELQALNEEMQAANEELQSSNEELETSNEELQSTNEELTTVNEELQVRSTELGNANADLMNIQDNVGFPMLVVDKSLRITRFTPQAARLFGLLPSDAGQLITAVPSQLHIKSLRTLLASVIGGSTTHEEVVENDGRIYRMIIVPYRDLHDQTAGAILSFIDETDLRTTQKNLESTVGSLRAAQADLNTAKEVAEAANHAKSEFLANMSHELRTPLNAILGFTQIMADEMWGKLGDPRYKEYAEIILDSGQHLLSLINQVLQMSKIEAGKTVLHDDPVNVSDLITGTVRLLSSQAVIAKVDLTTAIQAELPMVKGDQTALQRVILNLLGNSIKFTRPGGKISITASTDSDGMMVKVSDTGIGIRADDLERVLMPFEQGGPRVVREREGIGLGLPIAKSLVEMHGGRLMIESREGQGTVAQVHFPSERLLRAG
ncbi:MAG: PAS domain-containing protein, partial [Magnetospirillum sp.]|nr:PAS domain-containing protein [Magnetospirillum sp.]